MRDFESLGFISLRIYDKNSFRHWESNPGLLSAMRAERSLHLSYVHIFLKRTEGVACYLKLLVGRYDFLYRKRKFVHKGSVDISVTKNASSSPRQSKLFADPVCRSTTSDEQSALWRLFSYIYSIFNKKQCVVNCRITTHCVSAAYIVRNIYL